MKGENKVEDDDILYLANLKSLKSLNLSNNKLSSEGLVKLKKKFKQKVEIKFNWFINSINNILHPIYPKIYI